MVSKRTNEFGEESEIINGIIVTNKIRFANVQGGTYNEIKLEGDRERVKERKGGRIKRGREREGERCLYE